MRELKTVPPTAGGCACSLHSLRGLGFCNGVSASSSSVRDKKHLHHHFPLPSSSPLPVHSRIDAGLIFSITLPNHTHSLLQRPTSDRINRAVILERLCRSLFRSFRVSSASIDSEICPSVCPSIRYTESFTQSLLFLKPSCSLPPVDQCLPDWHQKVDIADPLTSFWCISSLSLVYCPSSARHYSYLWLF